MVRSHGGGLRPPTVHVVEICWASSYQTYKRVFDVLRVRPVESLVSCPVAPKVWLRARILAYPDILLEHY